MRLLMLLGVAACAPVRAYEGPPRPREEVARIRLRPRGPALPDLGDVAFDARVLAVDGEPLPRAAAHVEVRPGAHTLDVAWRRHEVVDVARGPVWATTAEGVARLALRARAGATYAAEWRPGADPPLRLRAE